MKLVLWHGYLLTDTGSNIYTRELTRACAGLGIEVSLLCQDPAATALVGPGVRVERPDIGGLLPVFVVDSYPDLEARHVGDFTAAELTSYIDANGIAIASAMEAGADWVVANHAVMGGPVAAAGTASSGTPFGVYVHGSELEYALRSNERLARLARRSLDAADVVFVGSHHIRQRTQELLGQGAYVERMRLLPPGVDVEAFHPRAGSIPALVDSLRAQAEVPVGRPERAPDPDAAERLADLGPFVLYFGKLMEQKGVHLLLDAWRVLQHEHPDFSLVVVGFGDARQALEEQARDLRVIFTGAMSHEQLQLLIPCAHAVVVPSVLAEAFGMVAAEAGACGVPPIVARHSGLAEVAEGLGEAGLTFESGSPRDLARRLAWLLALPDTERRRLGEVARVRTVERWSWSAVARRMVDLLVRRR